jgi:hypothetical protein
MFPVQARSLTITREHWTQPRCHPRTESRHAVDTASRRKVQGDARRRHPVDALTSGQGSE